MKLKVTVNQTEYEIDVEVQEEERQSLGPIVIGGSGGAAPAAPAASATHSARWKPRSLLPQLARFPRSGSSRASPSREVRA